MSFATSLNFTSANEDGASELAALASKPGDRVLCLTASGTRPLDLLLGEASDIIALDINPAQNHLLALKMAAIGQLGTDDLYRFLGLSHCDDRLRLYAKVAPALAPETKAYWDGMAGVIASGVWHSGRWEKVLRLGARLNRLVRGRAIDGLLTAPNLEQQARIWAEKFDDRLWHGAIRLLSKRWFWTHVIGEPGGAFLPDAQATEARLVELFRRGSRRILFGHSDFLTLVFNGRHRAHGPLPLHLRRENLPRVRDRVSAITVQTGGLTDLPRLGLGRFDGFSLSDFGSYCSQADYDACWAGVLASATPGARFCERIFMNPLVPTPDLASQVVVDSTLSTDLTAQDRAIIYDLRAGQLFPR